MFNEKLDKKDGHTSAYPKPCEMSSVFVIRTYLRISSCVAAGTRKIMIHID